VRRKHIMVGVARTVVARTVVGHMRVGHTRVGRIEVAAQRLAVVERNWPVEHKRVARIGVEHTEFMVSTLVVEQLNF
jgi:hypothetical protein